MEINLRKANAIQQEIRAAMREARAPVTISVTEFEHGEEAILKARTDCETAQVKCESLIGALYEIRAKVGAANEACGLNLTLTRISEIGELSSLYQQATAKTALRLDEAVLSGKVAKLREKPREGAYYGHSDDTVSTGVFDETSVRAIKARIDGLKREKRDLQDKLLALNVENTITLSEPAVAVLKEEGII